MAVFYKWIKGCEPGASLTDKQWTYLKWGSGNSGVNQMPRLYSNSGKNDDTQGTDLGYLLTSNMPTPLIQKDFRFNHTVCFTPTGFTAEDQEKIPDGVNNTWLQQQDSYFDIYSSTPIKITSSNATFSNNLEAYGNLVVGTMASDGWSTGGMSCDVNSGITQLWNNKIELLGQIDIGTNGSVASLTVPGYSDTDAEIVSQLAIRVDAGYVKAPYFNATSDRRAKENIKKAEFSGINTIKQLNVYNFNYKNSTQPSIGVIAQEALDIKIGDFSLVENQQASGENEDYMSIKESKLIYVLMKAIQEQQEQIEKLQSEIDNLKNH